MLFFGENRIRVCVSVRPKKIGGGVNTFSNNLLEWLYKNRTTYAVEKKLEKADVAIVIAQNADEYRLARARGRGCYVIHRIDEHIESGIEESSRIKHEKIRDLNKLADVTVYQSYFVYENMHSYLDCPANYQIIYNGGSREKFYPSSALGRFIGHVTWGIAAKKRLQILYEAIIQNDSEKFLLIGNQLESEFPFDDLPNVICIGPIKHSDMLSYFHQMKCLYFPSENDPCPNTVVEAMLAGLPVCYNIKGGTKELVKDCGTTLDEFEKMKLSLIDYRTRVLGRTDLDFDIVAQKYMSLYSDRR